MINEDGFRSNVGIIVMNRRGDVLWARRKFRHEAWQFPQGGISEKEQPIEAMYRELQEELGLKPEDVEVVAESKHWFSYRLPKVFIRVHQKPVCIGQKQKWFLLRLQAHDHYVNLSLNEKPEFDAWRWVNYWYPLGEIVSFKRAVYQNVLDEFADVVKNLVEDAP